MKLFKFILITFYIIVLISCGRDGQREHINNKYTTYPSNIEVEVQDYVTFNNK